MSRRWPISSAELSSRSVEVQAASPQLSMGRHMLSVVATTYRPPSSDWSFTFTGSLRPFSAAFESHE